MVDDSEADRNLCRLLLEESLGDRLEFVQAGDAATGLMTCREVEPDCVLLDYKLPDMTGLEFLARLRAAEHAGGSMEGPIAAVVMLTGLAGETIAVGAMKAGAQDYLLKDRITPEGLLSAIEKANEKIALLRSLKEERDRLACSLAEKEVLLKEVHHRVKNNLQVIASLLRLQAAARADNAGNGLPGEAELADALRESQHRVESMALIHEQLYENDDLRQVDLAKHATLLLANLFNSYGVDAARIVGRVEIQPLLIGVDRAIPAGLILNELISNALKHAFPNGRSGSIAIAGGRSNGRVTIAVRDDGIGIPEAMGFVQGLPRRPGSLGIEIVNILTKQLKGTLELIRGQGSTFHISFPES